MAPGVTKFIEARSPWKQTDEISHELKPGHVVALQRHVPVHIISHGFCILLYASLLAAYSVFSVWTFANEEPVENFSTVEAQDFGPVPLDVNVFCAACNVPRNGSALANNVGRRKWAVIHNYEKVEGCEQVGTGTVADKELTTVTLCRSTDDISDGTSIRVRLENVSRAAARPIVVVSSGDFKVSTPLEAWNEKTLLLGVTVQRNAEDCTSADDCDIQVGAYLASMQYDGEVRWGDKEMDTWAGAQLHIRMLRYAQVYTTVPQGTIPDVIAGIGGASGILVLVLGALLKIIEALFVKKGGAADAIREATLLIGGEAVGQVIGAETVESVQEGLEGFQASEDATETEDAIETEV